MTDPIELCAHGEAAWHAVAFAPLGAVWTDDGRLARAVGTVPHRFLLGGVTLTADATVPADVPGIVCDSFACLSLPGHRAEPSGHWMSRDPGAVPRTTPVPGLTIRPALTDDDVAWFESIAFLCDGELATPGELHPAGSQRQPGVTLLIAEIGTEGVGTALSVATDRVNNIGAVAVMPAQRRRGIGAALTEAAIAVAPTLPATLSATALGRGIYARLGFTEVGRPLHHHPV